MTCSAAAETGTGTGSDLVRDFRFFRFKVRGLGFLTVLS